MSDLLPDSRLSTVLTPKGAVMGPFGVFWIPIFCANCGADGGKVPDVSHNFAFCLCRACYDRWGLAADLLAVPEEAFWKQVNAEMMEAHGRILSPVELQAEMDAGLTPLASLLREGVSTI